jgi:hypothetical protein
VVGPANWISSWVVRAAKFFTMTVLAKKPRSRALHIIHIISLMMGSDDFKISHLDKRAFAHILLFCKTWNTHWEHQDQSLERQESDISAAHMGPSGGGLEAQKDMDDVTAANA